MAIDEFSADGIDLHTLSIARSIGEHGSITAAARALGYSQPAITQHLQRVERRLGVSLVMRTGRTTSLTAAGEILARHALDVSATLSAAGDELARLNGLQTGTVTLVGFPTASSTLVPALLSEVRRLHPGLTVRFVEAEPPEAVDLLRSGRADLAISFSYRGDREDPHGLRSALPASAAGAFDRHDLGEDEMVVLTRASDAGSDSIALTELAAREWIAGCPLCRGHLLSACDDAGFTPTIVYETDNVLAVAAMVEAGLGVALLPQLAVRAFPLPDAVVARSLAPRIDRTLHVLTARGRERIPAVAAVRGLVATLPLDRWGLGAPRS